jgi:NAD(P)-dependent dehydrogenase (short-subunit alcohol dehydrogenase family)
MNILVTGGASGVGKAITSLLAVDSTNHIYFTYSNSMAEAKQIEQEFLNASSIKCDFSRPEDMATLTSKMPQLNLDVLINNAYANGIKARHFHKINTRDILESFKNNIIPTVEITKEAIRIFRKERKGKIITILTAAITNVPPIGWSIYVANKAYLEMLTKMWANENSKFNITSNSVSPSFMRTGMTADTDDRVIEQLVSMHPLKKLLSTEEVAETVKFLVFASNNINGINLLMNAGVSIR